MNDSLEKICNISLSLGRWLGRGVLSLVLIFSGFVKAVDPLGTQYKLEDYAGAMGITPGVLPEWLLLGCAIALAATEFVMGVLLLFAISRRLVTKLVLAFMLVMTCLTVWIYLSDPVEDCGCFGDAIVLTNGETLLKNIVLLACAGLLAWRPLCMKRIISLRWQWITYYTAMAFILGIAAYSLYYLPIIDFRPYKVGANIPSLMEMPEGAEQPEYETTFILEKNGERREFTLENYPDSTWTFIDSKSKLIKKGYVPPIHDFEIQDARTGDDLTEQILKDKGYTLLLIAPHLEKADDTEFGEIDQIYEWATENNVPFYCLTASGDKGIAHWIDITGAEYPFCHTDETTLKTIIRSNPGLVLLKDGTIMGKWANNEFTRLKIDQFIKQ